MEKEKEKFSGFRIHDHPKNGWGPCYLPSHFKEIPYTSYSKGDKLGRCSDWYGGQRYGQFGRYGRDIQSGGMNMELFFKHEEDDFSFQIVENKSAFKTSSGYRRGGRGATSMGIRGAGKPRTATYQRVWQQRGGGKNRQNFSHNRWGNNQQIREASIDVGVSWVVVEQFDFAQLSKIAIQQLPEVKDICLCGKLRYYNPEYDRINSKSEKILINFDKNLFNVTTSEDPIILKESNNYKNKSSGGNAEEAEGETEVVVYATDAILSLLMCCPRSAYSWDISVEKIGGKLYFDKRDNSDFDLLTVNETSNDPPETAEDGASSINNPDSLANEATFINNNYRQQVLLNEDIDLDSPNPFLEEEDDEKDIASVGYRYRKFVMGNDISLVVRCELNGVMKRKDEEVYIAVNALNEYDLKTTEWRKKIDNQRGSVLATELKNNANKLARWCCQAILAGVQEMNFGYVSRVHSKNKYRHQILGTQNYKTKELASHINLNERNGWAILRKFITTCMSQPDGKYVFLKNPNKRAIALYQLPESLEKDDAYVEEEIQDEK